MKMEEKHSRLVVVLEVGEVGSHQRPVLTFPRRLRCPAPQPGPSQGKLVRNCKNHMFFFAWWDVSRGAV